MPLPQENPSNRSETELVALLTADFRARFESGLSKTELEIWQRHGLNPPQESDQRRIAARFDGFLIEQARVLGPKIYDIAPVRLRLRQWWDGEANGPELHRRLGEALAEGARVIRGQACLPIDDPAWYAFKQDAVVELRLLRNQLRNKVAGVRRVPSPPEITGLIRSLVEAAPAAFPRLAENLASLVRFLEQQVALARDFAAGDATPTRLYDEWAAWSTNRDVEGMRRLTSMMGSRKANLLNG